MNRLDTLLTEYTCIPKTIVIKADLLTEGLRYTDALRDAGKWAFPDSEQAFEWDVDIDKTAQDVKDGVLQIPEQFEFKNRTVVRIISDQNSPYHIERSKSGSGHSICYEGQELEPIFFNETPAWYYKKTSRGTLMGKVCMARAPCAAATAVLQFCEYFRVGKPCRYCNFNPFVEQQKQMGREVPVFKNMDDVNETLREIMRWEGGISFFGASGGALLDRHKEAQNYVELVWTAKDALGIPENATMHGQFDIQAMEKPGQQELYDAGLGAIDHNLEVWDRKLFSWICWGKDEYVGYEHWKECLLNALDFWEPGKVQTSFVTGVEMVQPGGFKHWKEGLESYREGFSWCMENEIVPRYNMFTPNTGSIFEDAGRYMPPTEYWLELSWMRHELMKEFGLAYGAQNRNYREANKSVFMDFWALGLED